jgi:carbamoyl-phosphate synthase/aspartate carbamoyltransferase/dihydroorotase
MVRIPGLIDAHVHLRVPGGEHKEDFRSGTAAALAGGFTMLMAMPNTRPPLTSATVWRETQARAGREGLCDVLHFAGVEAGDLSYLSELGGLAPALKVYLNETYNQSQGFDRTTLDRIASSWPRGKVLALHAEGESVAFAISLAAEHGRPVHICHVSRKEDIERIAAAKREGLPVTCEVTPHHLFLTNTDADRLGPLGDMRPRLADQRDVEALWTHLGTAIDIIASDHAPHTLEEKQDPASSPPGVPGLESTLPLLLTAVSQGRLSMERLVELLHANPARIYGLLRQADTWLEIDPHARYTFPENPLRTKCGWSPFSQTSVVGRLRKVVLHGRTVYADGQFAEKQT